jgi:phosphoenolpyruvate-protein phosphotransferase (PTS system enzyme I)
MRVTARGVVPGVAIGRAVVVTRDASRVRYRLAASGVERERHRLRAARDRTRTELDDIAARVGRTLGPAQAAIFSAQRLMLDDPMLARRVDDLIRTQRINAEWALERAVAELHDAMSGEGDEWVRERLGDVSDVSGLLLRHLRPGRDSVADLVREAEAPVILVASDLAPSTAAQLDWTRVRGLVCDTGSPTSHTVILARSLGVPAVVGAGQAVADVAPGQMLAIDGGTGEIVTDPSEAVLASWRLRAVSAAAHQQALDHLRDKPATTADGVRIRLDANLEIADEVSRARDAGAEGIGLYRSEFLLDPSRPGGVDVDEDVQMRVYRALLEAMAPNPVTIRTFDAAADADGEARGDGHRERFGARGIRAARVHDERFRTQIRALLRAADAGTLRILLPFVTTPEELQQVRAVITGIGQELGVSGVPIGAMIEVPAAALTVDALAAHADFLSVGTNDLIQYTLAVDRTDEGQANGYEPASPAVLRLLHAIVVLGRRARCPLQVCGEMAGDPVMVALLVGLGFRSFSVTTSAVPMIKRALATVQVSEMTRLARRARQARSHDEVMRLMAPVSEALRQAELAGVS